MIQKFKKNCLAVIVASLASLVMASPSVAATAKTKKAEAKSVAVSKSAAKGKKVAAKSSSSKSKAAVASSRKVATKTAGSTVPKSQKTRHASVTKRGKARVSQDDAPAVAAAPARLVPVRVATPVKPVPAVAGVSAASGTSFGQIYGLHHTQDPLDLKSSVALVMDQDTNEVLLAKNSEAVLPIASLTKLMTAMVVVEAHLPMEEPITVTSEDVDVAKGLISTSSPIGRGLLGKQIGDSAKIQIPGGLREMEIIELITIHES